MCKIVWISMFDCYCVKCVEQKVLQLHCRDSSRFVGSLTALAKLAKNARFIFSCGCGIWCGHWCGLSNNWRILPSEAGSRVWRSIATSEQWIEHTFTVSWARLHCVTFTGKLIIFPELYCSIRTPELSRAFGDRLVTFYSSGTDIFGPTVSSQLLIVQDLLCSESTIIYKWLHSEQVS